MNKKTRKNRFLVRQENTIVWNFSVEGLRLFGRLALDFWSNDSAVKFGDAFGEAKALKCR